jgi:TPR repeat protein
MENDLVNTAIEKMDKGDFLEAEKLLIKAAKAGNGHAAHNLGTLYAGGAPGIEVNREKSLKYYEQALESGFEEKVATNPTWFRKT